MWSALTLSLHVQITDHTPRVVLDPTSVGKLIDMSKGVLTLILNSSSGAKICIKVVYDSNSFFFFWGGGGGGGAIGEEDKLKHKAGLVCCIF